MKEATVLFALNVFDEVGGASRLLVELATGLALRGRKVAVYTAFPSAEGNTYVRRLRAHGIDVFEAITDRPVGRMLETWLGPLLRGGRLWRRLQDRGWFEYVQTGRSPRLFFRDLVRRRREGERVVLHIQRGREALGWAARCGVPALYVENSTPDRAHWIESWWGEVIPHLPAARVVVAGSEAAAAGVREHLHWKGPVSVLPWVVAASSAAAPSAQRGGGNRAPRADGRFVLGAAGRLSAEKGFDLLLQAVALLEGGTATRLRIAGDGETGEDLKRLARSLGVEARVDFLGSLSEEEMEEFWSGIDALVVPSRFEGSPMVVLDALARGVPVVATAVGGVPELLEQGACGLLVDERDPAGLAAAIALCRDDAAGSAARAEAGRRRIERVHGAAGLDAWIALYDALAEDR